MKDKFTITNEDPTYYEVSHRVANRTRKYKVNLRAGQVFAVVPDSKTELPICMYRMRMQRSVRDDLEKRRKPAETKQKESKAAEKAQPEEVK